MKKRTICDLCGESYGLKNFNGHKLRCLEKQNTQTARQEMLQQTIVNGQFKQNDHCASIGTRWGGLPMRTIKLTLKKNIRAEKRWIETNKY